VLAHPTIDGVERRGHPLDLSWTWPWWLDARQLPHVDPLITIVTAVVLPVLYRAGTWHG
jgi:hypothetical protein